ncbi:hypothetical protein [Halovivax limisalsi]|uniref:hypothetical protein n=1 Tax=Halovivax limisalsi TaxID=1453760 RepID=UPI001FFC2A97|nr:hypothetical protein [Halovivax limisalsi]
MSNENCNNSEKRMGTLATSANRRIFVKSVAASAITATGLSTTGSAEPDDESDTAIALDEGGENPNTDFNGCYGFVLEGKEDNTEFTIVFNERMREVRRLPGSSYDNQINHDMLWGNADDGEAHGFVSENEWILDGIIVDGEAVMQLVANPEDKESCNMVTQPDPIHNVEFELEGSGEYAFGFWDANGPLSEVSIPSDGEFQTCIPAGKNIICYWTNHGVQTDEFDRGHPGDPSYYDYAAGSPDPNDPHIYTVNGYSMDITDGPSSYHIRDMEMFFDWDFKY